ncbi:unnamed protein product [Cylicocyclus nassatus]|uniref:CXXC-type zinc finger protein 1 n=1 Tax=Cylicocyclus nassatus TaxID=53992 RepID=A0AA36H4U8_CYLNA|nr:unnamed protein product [Cylicocyclus nassatus]
MDDISAFVRLLLENAASSQAANNSAAAQSQPSASTDVKNEAVKSGESSAKPADLMNTPRCGECIGCFRAEDCGKCDGCAVGAQCLKRKCVQEAILLQKANKASQKSAQRKETTEVQKKEVKQEAAAVVPRRGPGRPRKDGHANARSGNSHINGDKEMIERKPARRSNARAPTSRRKHDAPKKVEPRQCIEPDCVKQARDNSKYCSDECGIKLAKRRLLTLLPQKVEEYYREQPESERRTLEELRAIDQKIGQIQKQTDTMLNYVRIIQKYVTAMKSTTSVSYDEPGDVDFMVNCTVCGMETNGRQLPKHVERCFVRTEKQTSFGTPTPAAFNPDNLFCEAYNKANNTYCKRVRVICAEHYKGELENELQICAYPKAWAEGKSLTFAEMFEHGPDLLRDQGFCCAPRKECAQHHRWVQALVGTIECERMNLLTRLDELLERRRIVSVGCTTRGDVISLLNFKPPIIAESSNFE